MADIRTVSEARHEDELDRLRGALLWLLWHHQGSSSCIGRACRAALGKSRTEPVYHGEVAQAKQWEAAHAAGMALPDGGHRE